MRERYFFHSRVGSLFAQDEQGIVMADQPSAVQEAVQTLSELLRDEDPVYTAGGDVVVTVSVGHADALALFSITCGPGETHPQA